ncbi:MAG TPA: hypothetical protein VKP30_16070 [Polyangiaceae bacterium]|nr:hypothetical protein [Polyangiaceae bacterium]
MILRLELVVSLWVGRLLLIWALLWPVYRLLGSSSFLQSTDADAQLFTSGAEQLVILARAQAQPMASLLPALTLLAAIAAGCALLASSMSWVSLYHSYSIRDPRLWKDCLSVLPRFAGIGTALLVVLSGLVTVWWELLPIVGNALVPLFGERRTDLCQLLILALLGTALGASFVVADVIRAVSLAAPALDLLESARAGLRLFRIRLIPVSIQAGCRFFVGVMLQVGNIWLIARLRWLASAHPYWLLACLTTEAAAISAIWLRLSWMAWLCNLVVTMQPRPASPECPQ